MLILQTNNISKSFGIDTILSDINIQIQSLDRIGLVGINGAGKSTLLKILAGIILPDSGLVSIGKGVKIGYLAQNSGLETNNTIWEEMLTVFSQLIEQEKQLRILETKIADQVILNNEEKHSKIMAEYARAIDDFKENGGYSYEAKIRGVLHGLGFHNYDYTKQAIFTLSGGQKTRLALAKLLLEEPNLLILDEPTNYLDVETLTWLENYLKTYPGAILIVSHDRYFLDALTTVIYEIEDTKATKYTGNYSNYIVQKAEQLELAMKKYEKQQTEISKLEDFVQKNIARASTTRRAQSRRKILEKMERSEKPRAYQKSASFSFDTNKESGNIVLKVNGLAMKFDDKTLFSGVDFTINKRERVALIGPNGVGKSTLFKLITKSFFAPQSGQIEYGSNVQIGYYDQEQDNLDYNKTIIDELWDDNPELVESQIRTILGSFLFFNDDVFKYIRDLSGGEKARVSLAKLMLRNANFLLLDEPTNHLDLYSREALENSLIDYSGTIFFISHDRYFLNRISTRIIELTPEGVASYLGNYDYYLEKKAEYEELYLTPDKINNGERTNKDKYNLDKQRQKVERQLRRRVESLELAIDELEGNISSLELELTNPEVYSDHQLAQEKNELILKAKEKIDQLYTEWEQVQQELEDF